MITIVCPVYNEVKYIDNLIRNFLSSKPEEKELYIIDGGSIDGTIEIVEKWSKQCGNIHLLFNNKKYVPFALNLAIKNSSGDPIIRFDAHTEYEKDYLSKILETFDKTGADIVGGPMIKKGTTHFQITLAYATSTQFGIGNSKIHRFNYNGESDHVYLGAWKRNLFDEIGFFDEKLIRNQDDEFHYRAKSQGKKIYLNSEIKSYYYPRSTWLGLVKQYFQYGFYKPYVLKKIKSEIKLRHLIPSVFSLYIISLGLLNYQAIYSIPLIIYFIFLVYYSVVNKLILSCKLISLIVYPSIHISYGLGFIIGLIMMISNKQKLHINTGKKH